MVIIFTHMESDYNKSPIIALVTLVRANKRNSL